MEMCVVGYPAVDSGRPCRPFAPRFQVTPVLGFCSLLHFNFFYIGLAFLVVPTVDEHSSDIRLDRRPSSDLSTHPHPLPLPSHDRFCDSFQFTFLSILPVAYLVSLTYFFSSNLLSFSAFISLPRLESMFHCRMSSSTLPSSFLRRFLNEMHF